MTDFEDFSGPAPGPGAYDYRSTLGDAPKWSFKGRHGQRIDSFSPGPGTYSTELWRTTGSDAPAKSMSSRYNLENKQVVPGPGEYDTAGRVGQGPSFSLSGRHKEKDYVSSPGPLAYRTEDWRATGKDAPAKSLASRTSLPQDKSTTPGPGAYSSPSGLGDAPKYSLSGRTEAGKPTATPGPNQYELKGTLGGPAFSLSGRTKIRHKY